MSEINILSPHVADLIAAGEVVDRPASVVKELVENAFDAGARTVTVEIRNGGATYIRVTDDGKGMAPEDAGVAFLRHATSKLSDERGLESIGTFGFRGEALAAISAVSRIEMTSRRQGAPSGVRMTLTAGDIQDMYETGCPEGTTMIIRDLFFNTPARLKFLKSDRAEGTACVQAAMKCALGRPDVSVRCIKDGKEEFFSPGDGKLDSCVYHLLGRDMAKTMIALQPAEDSIQVRGFISSPAEGRGNRTNQFIFVNGRPVKSPMVQKGLELAYRNRLLSGRYPYCVLYIDIPFGSVDVNVHPTKAEVKFSNEKAVYDAVYYTCLEAVGREDRLAKEAQQQKYWDDNEEFYSKNGHYPAKTATFTEEQVNPAKGVEYDESGRIIPTEDGREKTRYDIPLQLKKNFWMHDAASHRKQEEYQRPTPVGADHWSARPTTETSVEFPTPAVDVQRAAQWTAPTRQTTSAPTAVGDADSASRPMTEMFVDKPTPAVDEQRNDDSSSPTSSKPQPHGQGLKQAPNPEMRSDFLSPQQGHAALPGPLTETEQVELFTIPDEPVCEPFRVVGEVLQTYIIVEHGGKMTLIDKHAAHERMHFDRLSAYTADAPSQVLLMPEVIRLSREDYDLVWDNVSVFEGLGYELEQFGDNALMLRSVPTDLEVSDGRAAIEELCEHLRSGRSVTYDQVRQELLKTVACKAAIKAGKSSQPAELDVLARAVLTGKVKYCPHGRPVSVTYTKKDLDKAFDRIVSI